MDPDETLYQLRAAVQAARLQAPDDAVTARLSELFDALDDWLVRGGVLPTHWRTKP